MERHVITESVLAKCGTLHSRGSAIGRCFFSTLQGVHQEGSADGSLEVLDELVRFPGSVLPTLADSLKDLRGSVGPRLTCNAAAGTGCRQRHQDKRLH